MKFFRNKTWSIVMSIIIVIYGSIVLYCKSDGFDFSKTGWLFALDELKLYFTATGAIWLNYFVSVDKAKKEIREELEKEFKTKLTKYSSAMIEDGIAFIISSMELFVDVTKRYPSQPLDTYHSKVPGYVSYFTNFRMSMRKIRKSIEESSIPNMVNDEKIIKDIVAVFEKSASMFNKTAQRVNEILVKENLPINDRHNYLDSFIEDNLKETEANNIIESNDLTKFPTSTSIEISKKVGL